LAGTWRDPEAGLLRQARGRTRKRVCFGRHVEGPDIRACPGVDREGVFGRWPTLGKVISDTLFYVTSLNVESASAGEASRYRSPWENAG